MFFVSPRMLSPWNSTAPTFPIALLEASLRETSTISSRKRRPSTDEENQTNTGRCSKKTRVLHRSKSMKVTQNESRLLFTFDLPGVKHSDIEVTMQGNELKVVAERKRDGMVITRYAQRYELDEESFDSESVQATLTDGVLTVVVPKTDEKERNKQKDVIFEIKVENVEAPKANLDDKSTSLIYDLPGVKSSDIKVSYGPGKFVIDGERKKATAEYAPSKFHRVLAFNSKLYDVAKTRVFLEDGVLTILIPLKKPAPTLKIEVLTNPSDKVLNESLEVETGVEKEI